MQHFFEYLKSYPEINEICLFFGEDTHPKSKQFLKESKKIGYRVITKPVKYIEERRKCDFDVEITMKALLDIEKYETLLLFSGDGDYAPVIKYLLREKRVFVIASKGTVGKEIFDFHKEKIRPILIHMKALKPFIKKLSPGDESPGA